MSDRLPRLFGKYVLLKSLARGGMGQIYLAASDQGVGLSKLCVIKKIIAEKTDRAKINRFLDEAKVVLRLSHANWVPTFDAGDAGGELFIAMELVEGKDLREIWNRCVRTRTRIPLDVALQVVRETARALSYVHTYGNLRLVHRDVAPPNILLSYYGEVKLTDFGLARSALKQEHTAPGVVFGRASYLAPEQARGEVADARTDVYSLGIVLWELLTGQPYLQLAGLDPVTSLSLVRNPKTAPPSTQAPWVAPELDSIVLKALAADRANRFQSAEEMRRALSEAMTRVAPRADAERVTEFLNGLYHEVRVEEAAERERYLTEILPRWRGEQTGSRLTPKTDVLPEVAAARDALADRGPPSTRGRGESSAVARDGRVTSPSAQTEDTVVARVAEPAAESLHASALRARNVSVARRPPSDASGADAETKVWRRNKNVPGDGAGQTFVGRIVDSRYRIRHRIGEGGMGTVYAAEHVEIGKNVAVKILRRQYSGDKQLVERFRREARAASRVGHPNIIDVTDFGTTEDGCAYFVMEHLEGMDLADVIAHEGQLDPARTMRVAIQICRALHAAHDAGIIHRDLKPENIFLVARDGQADFVKVLDFGIARNTSPDASRLTNPGMTMGTPEYMAPEQVLGRPADARSDVYSLGALIYEMLIGGAPFRAATGDTMLDQKMRPLEPLRTQRPDVPAALDAVVAMSMAPDAAHRPQTMAALEYELTKILSGRTQAVTELLGLRELTAPLGETPGSRGEKQPTPVSSSEPAPPLAPARMRTADLEAFLEADLSPPPRINEPSALPPRRSPPSRPAVNTANAFLAANGMGLASARGGRGAHGAIGGMSLTDAGPVPSVMQRSRGRAAVALMLLVGAVASVAWFSRQGESNLMRQPTDSQSAKQIATKAAPPAPPTTPATERAPPSSAPAPRRATPIVTSTLPAAGVPPGAALLPRRSVPEVVPTKPIERARAALVQGAPDEAISLLRTTPPSTNPAVRSLLMDALVAAGTKAITGYHWTLVARHAREALALAAPETSSHGAHALLGDALFALNDAEGAIAEYQRALAETPRDARLRRHLLRARQQARPAAKPPSPTSSSASSASSSSAARADDDASSAPGEPATE